MTTLKSDCRKFSPNIFNKSKCQNCFRTKDAHSAEALESNRSTRKVSKCGYLFVAPDWDFSVSINRTKRWQRRWFVLYDDGELTYSVDEHPDTVPQAVIDMNKVLEVSDAQEITGNQFAIAITAPEKVHFVKGTCREESRWWYDVLSRLPRNNLRHCGKHKRNATFPGGKATTTTAVISDQETKSPETYCTSEEDMPTRPRFTSESIICQREDDDWTDWLHQQLQEDDVFPTKECNSSNNAATISPASLNDKEDEATSPVEENLVTKSEDSKEKVDEDANQKSRCRRYQKRENRNLRSQRSRSDGVAKMIPTRDSNLEENSLKPGGDSLNLGDDRPNSPIPARRRHTSDKVAHFGNHGRKPEQKSLLDSNLLAVSSPVNRNLKKSESLMNISSELSPEMKHHITELKRNHSYKGTVSKKESSKENNTCNSFIQPVRDSSAKPAVNSLETVQNNSCSSWEVEVDICTESMVLKKGWLLRRPTLLSKEEWSRHWFVLKNASFTYYRDPSAEDCGILDGVLDLNQVTSVENLETERHFAFSLIMWDNKKYVLATESAAARGNWVKAIQCASNLWDAESRRDFSNDEIVLPEHNFCTSGKSVEQAQDMSSSDDQSEYFSIIDDGEEEMAEQTERGSSPRTLPPSPPLNRTAMSLVKERARGRSNSYSSCSAAAKNHDEFRTERQNNEVNDLQGLDFCNEDSYQAICTKLLEMSKYCGKVHGSGAESKEEVDGEKKALRLEKCDTNVTDDPQEANETLRASDAFDSSRYAVRNFSDSQLHRLFSPDRVSLPLENIADAGDYKLKYELLKARYFRERAEWEDRTKQDESKSGSLSSYVKILQKTKRTIHELKEKFSSSGTNDQSIYVAAVKDLQQLCKEMEKMSPCSDKRMKREADVKKWRKGFAEMQVYCKNQQQKLQEVQSLNSSLSVELKKRERTLEELQQEMWTMRKEQFGLLQSQKSQDDSTSQAAIKDAPEGGDLSGSHKKLTTKLRIADAQIRRLKKDLKESHRSLDDLEIHCFQLKQDVKAGEESHLSQMALMTARVDDLTSKLTASERSLRQMKQKVMKLESKQERRRSSLKSKEAISLSKEYETKLLDLEHKLASIESELKSEDRLTSREDGHMDFERALGKRLSQDSSSSSENAGSLLLRLHSLGMRTKLASEAVKKQTPASADEVNEAFDKPKICLQVRHEGDATGQDEEEEECGEDWSTLSYTTSLTDLQTFDGLDGCDLPSTWPDIVQCLEHKLENLLSWTKSSVSSLQKQDAMDTHGGSNTDFMVMSSSVLEILDGLSELKIEAGTTGITKLCYKILLLSGVITAVHKIMNFESGLILEKLCVSYCAFKFMLFHFEHFSDSENQISTEVATCVGLAEKLLTMCCTPYDVFLNDSLDDFAQISQQSPNRILLLHQSCSRLVSLLDDAKIRQFSGIMQTLADIPVQDPEVSGRRVTLSIEDCQEFDVLLSNIVTTVSQFYKFAEHQICQLHHQNFSLLQCDHRTRNKWIHNLQKDLKTELSSVIEQLKKAYPQVREKNVLSCSLSDVLYKKIIYGSIALARVSLLRAVAHSVLSFLSVDNNVVEDENDTLETMARLRETYSCKAFSLSQDVTDASFNDSCEALLLNQIVETGLREIKMETTFQDLHQSKIETCMRELDALTSENGKLKCTCESNKTKLQEFQDKLEKITTKDYCDKCHAVETKLHSMQKLHEADLFALDRKCKEKMEEIHQHLQLVLEQKDEIHLQEVQKLEEQLRAAQEISSRVEMEYSQQVDHLKEIYQQKVNMVLDPINEESVRRRYQSEIEQLKDLWEKGLAAVQNSYKQMTVEMDRRHKQELSLLEAEKEKVLKEEAQATMTALEVMRRYHAEELQREVARCREEILRKTHPSDQLENFHEKYEKELEEVKREIMLLSEKFSVKCLENASLEEKVQSFHHQLQEANHQLIDLAARNKQLKVHLAIDIAEMKRYLAEREDSNESLETLKILLKLKENEIAEQKEENAQSKQELHLAQMPTTVPSSAPKPEGVGPPGTPQAASCIEPQASA